VINKRTHPKRKIYPEDFLGFFHIDWLGTIPNLPNVNPNHAKYKQAKPSKPTTPRVKEGESQGPPISISENEKIKLATPNMASVGTSLFALIENLKEPIFESLFIREKVMTGVSHGIIVAGGVGSRMFPASAYVAKEMLPLVDVPAIVHLILEAKNAGITQLHIITSPNKNLQSILEVQHLKHYRQDLHEDLFDLANGVDIQFHIQPEPKGFGEALMHALPHIDGPCLVLLGDNIILDKHEPLNRFEASTASKQLVNEFLQTNQPTVGLIEVAREETSHYGIAKIEDNKITSIVEKPKPMDAPSQFALCGRYIFTSDTLTLLHQYSYEMCGELQTIELQKHWMNEGRLNGFIFHGMEWYDSGLPFSWLKSQIDHGLKRSEYKDVLRDWLRKRID